MPRPVEIDRHRAIKAAKAEFWRLGYHATSMNTLFTATGMGAGSFYAAFGSKSDLFLLTLDDYVAWSARQLDHTHRGDAPRGLRAIRSFLEKTLVSITPEARRKGCLLVNSALELEGVNDDLYRQVLSHLKAFRRAMSRCLQQASAAGELREQLDAAAALELLMTQIQGLRVESRLGMSRAQAHRKIESLMTLLSKEVQPQ